MTKLAWIKVSLITYRIQIKMILNSICTTGHSACCSLR
jgi:hypothetical protein